MGFFLSPSFTLLQELANWDLRFMPNFYPLPPEMLFELEKSVLEWRREGKIVFMRQQNQPLPQSLVQLKGSVIHCVTTALAAENSL